MHPERSRSYSPPSVRSAEAGRERLLGTAEGERRRIRRRGRRIGLRDSVFRAEQIARGQPVAEREFLCPVPDCGRRFARLGDRRAHMRTHGALAFEEREFLCPFPDCGRRFSWASHRRVHMRTHGVLPLSFPPSIAGFGFRSPHGVAAVGTVPAGPAGRFEGRSGLEIAGTLVAAGFDHTLELGIVLGLAPGFLVSLLSDSTARLRARLALALPFNLESVACVLQQGSGNAAAIADAVRALVQPVGDTREDSADGALLDKLADLLRPLENQPELLNRALGQGERSLLSGVQESLVEQESRVRQVSRVTCHPAVSGLGSRAWIKALARAGTPVHTAREIAWSWEVPIPLELDDWDAFSCSGIELESISEDVVRWYAGQADAIVPLKTVWPLVRRYVYLPFFAPALDDGGCAELSSQPAAAQSIAAPQKAGVIALLRQAQASAGLRWELLVRLARCHLIEMAFIQHLPAGAQGVETVSRPVRPFDLMALMADSQNSAGEAMEIAAALGAGLQYSALRLPGGVARCTADQRTALRIWGYISSRAGAVQTGHLAQLFRELGRPDLLKRLTGDADSQMQAAVSLADSCPRAAQFIRLRRAIRGDPLAMLTFMARNNLEQHAGYSAPPGTALAVRLLNSLALDASVLETFEAFVHNYRPPSPTPAGEMGASSSGLPYDYACPITLDYMTAPVPTLVQGERVIYFEKAALLQALEISPCHPVTKEHLSPDDIRGLDVDLMHLQRIHQWRQAHPELEQDAVAFEPPSLVEQG